MKQNLLALASVLLVGAVHADLTVKATNKLPFDRKSQTIELKASDLESLKAKSLEDIHVKDSSGKELLTQAVDTDFDELHKPDIVIFQSDFGPNESKTFTVAPARRLNTSRRISKPSADSPASDLTTLRGRMTESPIARMARRWRHGKASRSPAAASTSGASARLGW